MKFTFLVPCENNFYSKKDAAPMGIAYIASYLEQQFGNEFEMSIAVDVPRLLREKPDIVGISAYTEGYNSAIAAAEIIKKELNVPVIIGGKHITALPTNLKPIFDVGVVGDGERTVAELMQAYVDKKGFYPEDLVNIKGIVFRDGKELHVTEEREPLKNLDILPPPKRDLLKTYWPGSDKEWMYPQGLFTSRGCPYKCPFCIHSNIKFVTRYHSPQRIIQEIEEIVTKYPNQKIINIHDDLFTISKKRLRELVDLIVEAKFNRKVSFFCMCKSNLFDDEIAEMLKEMNVTFVGFGFESGDEATLQYLKKDSSKVIQNLKALEYCNKYGIHTMGYFLIGSPPETTEAINKTYWFIRNNYPPMSVIGIFGLTPFPGTKSWDYALEKGVVNPETENWDKYSFMEYENKKEMFLNEHYEYEFFREAFNNHFHEFRKKGRILPAMNAFETEGRQYSEMFALIKNSNLKYDDKILEVGSLYNESIKNSFDEEKKVTSFDHWIYFSDEEKINEYETIFQADKQFDVLVFNSSLTQMINPMEKLEYFVNNYLKDVGKIIIIVKNPQFMERMVNLMLCKWESLIAGHKKFDDLYQISIPELKNVLEKLNIKNIEEHRIKGSVMPYVETYKTLLPIIAAKFDVNPFIANSDTYYFMFVGQKSKGVS